ncbi:MAG: DUF4349 domain-containing protein, partial [Dermatophilaceae bacterium]
GAAPTDEGVTMRTRPRPARLAAVTLAAAATIAALGACSSSDDSGAAGSAADNGSSRSLPEGGDAAKKAPAAGRGSEQAAEQPESATRVDAAAAVAQRRLTRKADVALEVKDVAAAASRVRTIAVGAGGLVVGEQLSTDATTPEGGGTRPAGGTVTISVPSDKLDGILDDISKVGAVVIRTTSTEDVTAQYVDTESRVESAKASVERVRALMSRATTLADVVTLEAELSRRQADLEALQGQLAALKDATALSPVTVRLSTDGDVTPEEETDDTGFLAGLAAGWEAFTVSVAVLLTVIGALLPFAVAVAVVAGPFAILLRRRSHGAPAAAPPVATPPVA